MTIRVLIADDQPVVRDGLAMLLDLIDDVEVVAADGIEAVERARAERPDIVLMDLRMPRLEGAEATRQILASLPDTRVLVLTNDLRRRRVPVPGAPSRRARLPDQGRDRRGNRGRDQGTHRRPHPPRPRRPAATHHRRRRSDSANPRRRTAVAV
jgi:CheY-like chemotaxis protein